MSKSLRNTGRNDQERKELVRNAKVPPHSQEAEQAVLGSLMIDHRAWDRIADLLNAEDFYRHTHQLIYQAMIDLASRSQPFDVLTVSETLKGQQKLEAIGDEGYLFELAQNTPTSANIEAYATIVRERAILRKLIGVGTDIVERAYQVSGLESKELLDTAEQQVFQISEHHSKGAGPVKLTSILAKTLDRLDDLKHQESHITGLGTGFSDFDHMTAGLQKGDLIIVAGRPSMGKTSFAMNIAENVAFLGKNKKPVLIFSMEMPAESLTMRMLSSMAKIDFNKVRTGKLGDHDWAKITQIISIMSESHMYIDDTAGLTPNDVRSRARRVAREHPDLGLIVIDYLQLMRVPGTKENRTNEISEISRSLKILAKELHVPVIALSQLNRGLEQRTDRRPVMSDLRECVPGDTLVILSDGRRVPIQELVDTTPEVLSINKEGKIIATLSDKVWPVGKKQVFSVHLASGRIIQGTEKHRLLGPNGWKMIGELTIGDRLAVVNAELLNDDVLRMHCNSDLFWDRVVAIIPAGEMEVYDLTVPETECWLADGIVSHNSGAIEQDADLIAFIYRDEVYDENSKDKGIAEIIIRKQRNGPIGDFKATFLGQYTRFESYASMDVMPESFV